MISKLTKDSGSIKSGFSDAGQAKRVMQTSQMSGTSGDQKHALSDFPAERLPAPAGHAGCMHLAQQSGYHQPGDFAAASASGGTIL